MDMNMAIISGIIVDVEVEYSDLVVFTVDTDGVAVKVTVPQQMAHDAAKQLGYVDPAAVGVRCWSVSRVTSSGGLLANAFELKAPPQAETGE